MTKHILKSKTFWVGMSTICTGLGLFFSGEQQLQELSISVVGVVFTVLRLVTSSPVKMN